jgi:hypothetical protein
MKQNRITSNVLAWSIAAFPAILSPVGVNTKGCLDESFDRKRELSNP